MNNAKLNVYKKVLQEVYEEFDGSKIEDKIEEIYSNEKLSVEKVTYLFMNDCDNFKVKTSCVKHHFECIVTTLIFVFTTAA